MKKKVVAIGEILWDVFPSHQSPGGSSMNVALHLHKQHIDCELISAIGDDRLGTALKAYLGQQDFPTSFIQTNYLPTSTVQIELDEKQQARYTILEPVAWDEIQPTPAAVNAVKEADAFVFCSLTCRNEVSRKTIFSLLPYARLKVFDINLRPPFYTEATLLHLLNQTDLLKINEEELTFLANALQFVSQTAECQLQELGERFGIQIICLTLGDRGAAVWSKAGYFIHQGYQIEVVDTVGAGDAFLATFIASHLKGNAISTTLDSACRVGSFVAAHAGANPAYNIEIAKLLAP
ncbi:MAG: carbohydrate kinase [Pedobacter sp.]|nr:carbohydrate kinase [Pedobacter sp.]MDQ8053007.1 carbohydrate kinase [Pedobacter sp.]